MRSTRRHARGAMTFALPGTHGSYTLDPPSRDPFIHQELVEILYHTLWETVHVFFEHRELGLDVGDSAFLYPFLTETKQQTNDVVDVVAESIEVKAREDAMLRERAAREESEQIANAARAIHERLQRGGKLILFGNGGSATDANDFALDCVQPPAGWRAGTRGIALDGAGESYGHRQRRRSGADLSPADDRAVAPGRRRGGDFPPAADRRTSSRRSKKRASAGSSPWPCWVMTAERFCAAVWSIFPW